MTEGALLEKGSMDKVRTGDEPLPEMKGVLVKIVAPAPENEKYETFRPQGGEFEIVRFNCEILTGEFKGRRVPYSAFINVAQQEYLSWNLRNKVGDPLSQAEKLKAWEEGQFRSDLKRLGRAIEVDFEEKGIVDAYGKEFIGNIIQRLDRNGEPRNEVKYPKKVKSP